MRPEPTARELLLEFAACYRAARKERSRLEVLARRHAGDVARFRLAAGAFYAEFGAWLAGALVIARPDAEAYCRERVAALQGLAAPEIPAHAQADLRRLCERARRKPLDSRAA